MIRKVTFGRTGLSVSVLGFVWPIGYLDTERERVARILNFVLDAGVNLIDTASNYPGAEEAIADTVGQRRDEYVLVSKCGPKLPDLDERAWSPELITKTVDRSLRQLRTDRLDVMLLHSLPTSRCFRRAMPWRPWCWLLRGGEGAVCRLFRR